MTSSGSRKTGIQFSIPIPVPGIQKAIPAHPCSVQRGLLFRLLKQSFTPSLNTTTLSLDAPPPSPFRLYEGTRLAAACLVPKESDCDGK